MRKIYLVLVCTLAVRAFAADPVFLNQNWSEEDRQWFYTTPQGSKLIPYAWALSLEMPNDETRWASTLTRFGFIANGTSSVNPHGLPVGVVRDGEHLGLTCAACHTAQIEYGGTPYRIDGGPTDADLYEFLADLGKTINATATSGVSSPKFLRFAKAVLGTGDTPAARQTLYAELRKFNAYMADFIEDSTPSVATWGPARTDAFGMIFNRVTNIDLDLPANNRSPNAPVSYPFLWDTSWHNKVQWNGVAPNTFAVERLARNVGEVLGVFADIEIKKPTLIPFRFWYPSTANRINLLDLEDRLSDLRSPKWPAAFPALDPAKVSRGQALYQGQCLSCHAIATPGKHQNITLTALNVVDTDPTMTVVSANRTALTGRLKGVKSFLIFGDRLKASAPAGTITLNATIGAILSPTDLHDTGAPELGDDDTDMHDDDRARLRAQLLEGPSSSSDTSSASRAELETSLKAVAAQQQTLALTSEVYYKARPLDGIWATGPYLHNGSVPTLWDLMKPPAERPKQFYVGSREFDPVNVGQRTNEVPGSFLFKTSITGNLNGGHVWGTQLPEEDRWAIIEYLKSL